MKKKSYIKPLAEIFPTEHLMEGDGPVQNTGTGYKFYDDPVNGDDLESKWFDFDAFCEAGKFNDPWEK